VEKTALKVLILGTLATLLISMVAQFVFFGGEELSAPPLDKLSSAEMPGKILVWLDQGKGGEGYAAFYQGGDLFLAARLGERPTGGYEVFFSQPRLEQGEAVVTVECTRPKPWDIVVQVLTYPRTAVKISTSQCPDYVRFVTVKDEELARVQVIKLEEGKQ
jgi:hypothetical protein